MTIEVSHFNASGAPEELTPACVKHVVQFHKTLCEHIAWLAWQKRQAQQPHLFEADGRSEFCILRGVPAKARLDFAATYVQVGFQLFRDDRWWMDWTKLQYRELALSQQLDVLREFWINDAKHISAQRHDKQAARLEREAARKLVRRARSAASKEERERAQYEALKEKYGQTD